MPLHGGGHAILRDENRFWRHFHTMSRNTTVILSTCFILLACMAGTRTCSIRNPMPPEAQPSAGQSGGGGSTIQGEPGRPGPERRDRGASSSHSGLEAEFDKILPAQFPEQFSSLCDATLQPGESLVLGGFRKPDGNYEFTMLEVEPIGADGAPLQEGAATQYKVTLKNFGLSREKSMESGFGSLISPAMTRIQKSIAFPPGETPSIETQDVATMPTVVTRPDQTATIQMGSNEKAYMVSMIVSSEDSGKSIRIRTRVESPSDHLPLR